MCVERSEVLLSVCQVVLNDVEVSIDNIQKLASELQVRQRGGEEMWCI